MVDDMVDIVDNKVDNIVDNMVDMVDDVAPSYHCNATISWLLRKMQLGTGHSTTR